MTGDLVRLLFLDGVRGPLAPVVLLGTLGSVAMFVSFDQSKYTRIYESVVTDTGGT